MNISHHKNYTVPQPTNNHKNNNALWKSIDEEPEKAQPLTMAEKLAQAIADHTERTLRGPGGLTEEEIQEKLEEFIAEFKPENGTEAELKAFFEKLQQFEQSLREHNDKIAIEFLRMRNGNKVHVNDISHIANERRSHMNDLVDKYGVPETNDVLQKVPRKTSWLQ